MELDRRSVIKTRVELDINGCFTGEELTRRTTIIFYKKSKHYRLINYSY